MICLLAASKVDAIRFAAGQFWKKDEWFYGDEHSLMVHDTYHIIRLPGFFELPADYWSRIDSLAVSRQRYLPR